MLQITPQHKLYIATEALDFRKGIDAIAAYCRGQIQRDPFSGQLFVFRNKRFTAVKLLNYDGNGFWLCQKRFSKGKIAWWPQNQTQACAIRAVELLLMLGQGDPQMAKVSDEWRQLHSS